MPLYDIKVDLPNRPKGDEIEVPPFGVVENGKTMKDVEMTSEEAERFKNTPGMEITDRSNKVAATTTEGGDK